MKTTNRIILLFTLFLISVAPQLAGQESKKPELFGVVKAKYEVSTNDGYSRFNVRNSRLGVKGFATDNLRYSLQMELNSQGNFNILDSYVAYRAGSFELSLGQQAYGFSTELSRGAAGNYFANYSFLGDYITRYYEVEDTGTGQIVSMGDIGPRDIGVLGKYKYSGDFWFSVSAGLFNGSGINNPVWNNSVNFTSHFEIGTNNGLSAAASYYTGRSPFGQKMQMWGVEARYIEGNVVAEAEFARRYLETPDGTDIASTGIIYALYRFMLPENQFARTVSPLVRLDMGDNIKFVSNGTRALERFDGQRITAGITVGLTEKLLKSEIRFNYEHYFLKNRPSDFTVNRMLHNKFSVEFFVAF